jgi:hypothetical protein
MPHRILDLSQSAQNGSALLVRVGNRPIDDRVVADVLIRQGSFDGSRSWLRVGAKTVRDGWQTGKPGSGACRLSILRPPGCQTI